MSATNTQYPAFDHLEVNIETEFGRTEYKKLTPAVTGDNVAIGAGAPTYLGNNSYTKTPALSKILVVYFYSAQWGAVGLEHLKQLNAIRNEVRYQDGSIVVVDADGDDSTLQQLLWNHNLLLPVHTDVDAQIAKAFGVYSEDSPAWDLYAGLNSNVPLPSLFVVDHFFNVTYHHHNTEIDTAVPTQQILSSVYRSNNYLAAKRTA
ncbi:peroxiredoxin family protein [Mucilaginibacter daejeonensis]|uniref:redoxin domain-containing protein n=1 Tax=Mucilaginibacter daejeonensis TaxID=398049 RepID=UPI001D174072|nr:redoxin domain-containing protein [Mucilaginibacter daejeonensis]UEG51647.1 peroxiredoxin family protein [Mucilaginibacter daejeonensis]